MACRGQIVVEMGPRRVASDAPPRRPAGLVDALRMLARSLDQQGESPRERSHSPPRPIPRRAEDRPPGAAELAMLRLRRSLRHKPRTDVPCDGQTRAPITPTPPHPRTDLPGVLSRFPHTQTRTTARQGRQALPPAPVGHRRRAGLQLRRRRRRPSSGPHTYHQTAHRYYGLRPTLRLGNEPSGRRATSPPRSRPIAPRNGLSIPNLCSDLGKSLNCRPACSRHAGGPRR